jgi:hypothetical protein
VIEPENASNDRKESSMPNGTGEGGSGSGSGPGGGTGGASTEPSDEIILTEEETQESDVEDPPTTQTKKKIA